MSSTPIEHKRRWNVRALNNGKMFARLYIYPPSVSCVYDYNSLMQQKYKFHIICQCQKHSTILFVRGTMSKSFVTKKLDIVCSY